MMNNFILFSQIFISIVITIQLLISCKKQKQNNQIVSTKTAIPPPVVSIPTESHTASSPDRKIAITAATPANIPKSTNEGKQGSVIVSKTSDVGDDKKREKEKKPEKTLNSAFNERLKEDTSAGISETV